MRPRRVSRHQVPHQRPDQLAIDRSAAAPHTGSTPPTRPSAPDPHPPPSIPTPTPPERLLEDLACDHDSLLALSKAYGATLDGLCEWMQRPENAVRIARISAAAAQRAHLAASIQLPKCVVVLVDMVKGYHHQETHDPIRNDLKQCRLRETQRANARKAIHLLYTFNRIGAAPARSAPLARSALRADSGDRDARRRATNGAATPRPNPATPPDSDT
ncbi:MAG: hypothetical protein H6811_08175 [Phycisphaeraceae bacterium]|nr:hypothetical protein [Phycisphaeraceae bacterium]